MSDMGERDTAKRGLRTGGNGYSCKVAIRAADNHIDTMLLNCLVNPFSSSPLPTMANFPSEVFVSLRHLDEEFQCLLIRAVVCNLCVSPLGSYRCAQPVKLPLSSSTSALSLLNWTMSAKLLTLENFRASRYCSKPLSACSPGTVVHMVSRMCT